MEASQIYRSSTAQGHNNTSEIVIEGGSDIDIFECEDIDDETANAVISDECDEKDNEEDDDDPPMLHQNEGQRRKPVWRKVRGGQGSERQVPEWLGHHANDDGDGAEIRNPIVYFRRFFTCELLDNITSQSNLYATQKDANKTLNLTKNELEQFIGSLMWMSILKLSNTRSYWRGHMANLLVAKVFSRDRWETIKSNLHFNDNTYMPDRNGPNFDNLYKIRPIISSLKEIFRAIPMTSRLCIHEQMVPFKGRSCLKRYILSKPHKCGFKLFILSDVYGMVYDFEVYTGKILPVSNRPDLGASSNIVIQLAECIPDGLNFQLYFDNWFTPLPLLVHLAKRQIYSIGTIRSNRLQGADLINDKALQAKGRGAYEEKETTIDDVRIRAVKWHDSRAVILVSTFASAEPLIDCQRYEKRRKENVTIPKPNIVDQYNSFMGGVELLHQLIALYRIQVSSKKYYHKFFFHFIDMAVVNSWLLYRRDCDKYGVQ
ncbi:UNVERIFIED_CONTAM: hypothetical protein GTU68_017635, partial [Idotea baltica]|nr:hypothetical protein [Idotea baltica]